jgi:NADH-quinone oxidoreductase subunit H
MLPSLSFGDIRWHRDGSTAQLPGQAVSLTLWKCFLPAPVCFTLKTLLMICLMMWIRWTLPRLRIDQMMGFCWKLLVPLALVLFCVTAAVAK